MSAYRRTFVDHVLMGWASLSVGLIVAASVIFTVSLWWPYEPLTRLEVTVTGPVVAGGELPVSLDYCKTSGRWIPREVRWTLINDVTISVDGPKVALPVGCDAARHVAIALSDHVAPGRYRLQADVLYEAWPWREIVYSRRSLPFQILPRPEATP